MKFRIVGHQSIDNTLPIYYHFIIPTIFVVYNLPLLNIEQIFKHVGVRTLKELILIDNNYVKSVQNRLTINIPIANIQCNT